MVIKAQSILLVNGLFQNQSCLPGLMAGIRDRKFDVLITFDEDARVQFLRDEEAFIQQLSRMFKLIIRVYGECTCTYANGSECAAPSCIAEFALLLPRSAQRSCLSARGDADLVRDLKKHKKNHAIVVTRFQAESDSRPDYSVLLRDYIAANKTQKAVFFSPGVCGARVLNAQKFFTAGPYERRSGLAVCILGDHIDCFELVFSYSFQER